MTEKQLDELFSKCNTAPVTGYVMLLGPRKFFVTDTKLPIEGKRIVFEIWDSVTAEDINIPKNMEMKYI